MAHVLTVFKAKKANFRSPFQLHAEWTGLEPATPGVRPYSNRLTTTPSKLLRAPSVRMLFHVRQVAPLLNAAWGARSFAKLFSESSQQVWWVLRSRTPDHSCKGAALPLAKPP